MVESWKEKKLEIDVRLPTRVGASNGAGSLGREWVTACIYNGKRRESRQERKVESEKNRAEQLRGDFISKAVGLRKFVA
jgi:hypothetical protein